MPGSMRIGARHYKAPQGAKNATIEVDNLLRLISLKKWPQVGRSLVQWTA